jgi:hypothetical protein
MARAGGVAVTLAVWNQLWLQKGARRMVLPQVCTEAHAHAREGAS